MSKYLNHIFAPAAQTEKADPRQVKNSAGGFTFAIDDFDRLERFLILGSEGGTYYATERKLTRENAECVARCLAKDGPRTVKAIVDVSDAGRAPKNDPAILALAMAMRSGDPATKAAAKAALPKVCRIGTHLYHFVEFADKLGGWGRGTRGAIASWFNGKEVDDLAHQLVKYQQRDGWSAKDLLRLSHAKPRTKGHAGLFGWCVGAELEEGDRAALPAIVLATEELKKPGLSASRMLKLISDYKLPREVVPTQHLSDPRVWEAMLPHMGVTAMIRNLATMTRVGVLAPMTRELASVCARIQDAEVLKKGRVHPIQVLSALRMYSKGRGEKGQNTWTPIPQVVDALDAGFYASFASVQPTGKATLLALDVSGSMAAGDVGGCRGLSPREASAVMAMVTAAAEPRYHVVGFSGGIRDLPITPKMKLNDAIRVISGLPFDRTDCALPMLWAWKGNFEVDSFAVYTDNETWGGAIHPHKALEGYRQASGRAAKLAVVGMTATEFSIANPSDPGMMDFVGFDSSAPAVMADFFRGTDRAARA
jgi:60 kDa SS-A/Ro ribonucleoprotein